MKIITSVILCLAALLAKGQDFGPQPPARHFGLGLEPLSGKIGARAVAKRVIFSLDFAAAYVRVINANAYFYDVKGFYIIHKKPAHRFYTGGGVEFIHVDFDDDYWTIDGYLAIIPLGIEIFPSAQAPNLSIVLEGECFALTDWSANLKIFYYLK
jgi:hypothetical protein